jgi:prepilin-type N-terminal cleavage/methylation domain-containing protein
MKYSKSIHGLTLVEILIGIVVSTIIMTAMYGTYSAVNSSYSQVTDRAKISQSNRNVIGMIVRDIRMAGFKYYGDTIATNNQHIPILITRSTSCTSSY